MSKPIQKIRIVNVSDAVPLEHRHKMIGAEFLPTNARPVASSIRNQFSNEVSTTLVWHISLYEWNLECAKRGFPVAPSLIALPAERCELLPPDDQEEYVF